MPVLDRYGPLLRDPHRILDLPEGFRYRVISRTGDRMADGFVVPGFPDGMAAFSGRDGKVILIRNHELESKGAAGIARFLSTPRPIRRAKPDVLGSQR